ncbi:3-ketoacyl-CoA thiolase, mitochondrial-like [Acropora millepora]|uniref:3-ketoacyl-CoA thiolase, mitochondrial-like n=1 Tax=Acropora millepora TaxID=45264 RepID=UPI001CF1E99F|nr:3-ketoacyl-CoA thiolase, mitochondrial-like [Acropora millepora]
MAGLVRPVYIVAAKRTAFGAFGGKLKGISATVLGQHAAEAALAAGNVDPATVDSSVFGNVIQSANDAAYISRHIALKAGVPVTTPAVTVNRLCGSGFQAIVTAAQEIQLGESDIVLCGGSENMSQAPYALRDARFGTRLGLDLKLEDTLWQGLTDFHVKLPMGVTGENLAEKYNITREECDEFALLSQKRWAQAQENGRFVEEIVSVSVKGKKGPEEFKVDEHPKPNSTIESLAKLPAVFKKDGTITAANASGICDGAAALIAVSEKALKEHNLTPLARIVSYAVSGVEPSIMGIGPVPAIKAALKSASKSLQDMKLIEVNEAFAPQFLAVQKELELDMDKTNVNGGAIALGHPVGTSGARITGHLVHELRRKGDDYAIGSACIGGGQGIAIVLENTQ